MQIPPVEGNFTIHRNVHAAIRFLSRYFRSTFAGNRKTCEIMETKNKVAFITGATSGIGKEFACRFAGKGFDLIITGRRKQILAEVASVISSTYGVNVEIMTGDLCDSRYRDRLCKRIMDAGNIEVLINNAGFGIDREFYGIRLEGIRSMIGTHALATAELIHAVLPGMIARGTGTIINVSSLGAFIPGFTRSLYLGTKSFVHYFSEALSAEIRHFGIKVQSLCPGMTESDFHRGISDPGRNKKMHLLPFMRPEKVVSASLRSLEKEWLFCIPGAYNKLLFALASVLPPRLLILLAGFQHDRQQTVENGIPCSAPTRQVLCDPQLCNI